MRELEKINVLIFPAGSEIAFEIFNSLKYNIHLQLFGASGKADHAKYIYDTEHYYEDDFYVSNSTFLDRFNNLIERLEIDLIFPTHDTITLFLAQNREKIKAIILTSPYETALIAREKRLTYDLFSKYTFCPTIYGSPDETIFPVFVKPNIGEGGKGTWIAENRQELMTFYDKEKDLILCEYLPGEELSVDCFTDRNGKLLFIGPRTRERVQIGISFHSKSVPLTLEIQTIGEAINNSLKINGAWFFQVKKDKQDKYKLMEFAVRQASTMGLYRQLGVNFALLTIFNAIGKNLTIIKNKYNIELDRALYNKYKIDIHFSRVYIDFDDTIILNNKVNEIAMFFLYRCRNEGIEIILLTKHELNIDKTFEKYKLPRNLFDKIIILNPSDSKVNYINPEGSIYIDNYFFDRENVSRILNIPVFDLDAIESLIK